MTTEPIYATLAAERAPARAARHTAILTDLTSAWAALDRAEDALRADHADHGLGGLDPNAARALIDAVAEARSRVMWAAAAIIEVTRPPRVDLPRRLTRTWGDPAPAWDDIVGQVGA